MPHHVFTRQKLYDMVWAEPTRTVARAHGVSDVGLAKACRLASIPIPPRGYWSKLKTNKSLPPRPPLKRRGDRPDCVVLAPPRSKPAPSASWLEAAAVAAASPIAIAADLRSAHPIVRAWVRDAAQQKREHRRRGCMATSMSQLDPLTDRRLRITSALLQALERGGCAVSCVRDVLTATLGNEAIAFRLFARSRIQHRPAGVHERRWGLERQHVRSLVPAGDLVLSIRASLSTPTRFSEQTAPLESQLAVIVASLKAGLAELAERTRQRHAREARQAADASVEQSRRAAAETRARLGRHLVDQARDHQSAEAIRAYVAAADRSTQACGVAYRDWRLWALAEADQRDPLSGGAVLAPPPLARTRDPSVK